MALFTATLNADTLLGGDGNDIFLFTSAEHAAEDLVLGGGGNDEVRFASTVVDGETLFLDPDSEFELVVIGTGTAAAAVTTGTLGHDVVASAMTTAVRIVGNAGANMLVGGIANDTLVGGAGNDWLLGGEGEDRIEGGIGADYLDGEEGNDTYVVNLATELVATDLIADSGDIFDTDVLDIRLASGVLIVGANVQGVERITLSGATAASAVGVNLSAAGPNSFYVVGNNAANAITGSGVDDSIEGGGGADSMAGGNGDDEFYVMLAAHATGDKYVGGAGYDTVFFWPATQQTGAAAIMVVGAGSSSIEEFRVFGEFAHGINAAVLGATAGARFVGNNAANTLTGGAGNDVFLGWDGNDSFVGGAGFDVVNYSEGPEESVTASLLTNTASGDAIGNDTFSGMEGLVGNNLDDLLTGNTLANRIEGRDGSDTITGGAGADTMLGGFGMDIFLVGAGSHATGDVINGGEDVDQVNFTSTSRGDTLTVRATWTGVEIYLLNDAPGTTALNINAAAASAGAILAGNEGANSITGSNHADEIGGAGGNDFLDGRGGADSLIGGDGADRLLGGAGNDRLDGGSGADTVYYGDYNDGGTINLATGIATTEGGTDTLIGIENVIGTFGPDVITGNGLGNSLSGGGGSDTLNGGAGNDTLEGGSGNNLVDYTGTMAGVTVNLLLGTASGGAGNDVLSGFDDATGGSGNDLLIGNGAENSLSGGGGNDTLVAGGVDGGAGVGKDTLAGNDGIDTADFSAATGPRTVLMEVTGAFNLSLATFTDMLYDVESVVGSAFDDALAGSSPFGASTDDLRLDGGGGNDTLRGSVGNDTFTGGTGGDAFIFAVGAVDVLTDFETGVDHGDLSNSIFAGTLAASTGGVLNAAAFRAAADLDTGGSAGEIILYDTGTGNLYYDADADGDASNALHFATLADKAALAASDLRVIG